ncbi:MAG: polyprenyl synthetase family protein, partial [Anaerolineales bacterium]
ETDSVRVMRAFSRTLMVIVNGEINQMFVGRGQASREGYLQRIYAKTASLFAVASEAAAVLGEADETTISIMRTFGREVGMAFQIMDDILDFTGDESHLGKPVGSDLRQGLFTLPVLHYLEAHPDDRDAAALLNGSSGDSERVERLVKAVRDSGAVGQALAEAKGYVARAQAALESVPDNEYRRALADLAEFFVSRNV